MDNRCNFVSPVVAWRFRWESDPKFPENWKLDPRFDRHRRHSYHLELAQSNLSSFQVIQ